VNYTVTVNDNVSNQAVVAINITSVNDAPVAANITAGAVNLKANSLSLITGATDPDGNNDVKDAVITSWPAQLGAQPTPVNGVISYTPNTTGNFVINYQVKDAAGLLSNNTAAANVTVLASESIVTLADQFTISKGRWVITATDTVRSGQTVTIAYADGVIKSTGQVCNGTAAIPACVIGSTTVPANGAILFDQVGFTGLADPTSALWQTRPRNLRMFSSSPVLGGSATAGVVTK
jgi:hypothetical protein